MASSSRVKAALPSSFPFGSAVQLARAVRTGKVGAVELLQAYLERVDRLNPAINAVVVDDRAAALKQARAADRALAKGAKVGPLHGVPITVKESFNLVGGAAGAPAAVVVAVVTKVAGIKVGADLQRPAVLRCRPRPVRPA